MKSQSLIDLFAARCPVCVMVRATLENILSEKRLNRIFDETAELQELGHELILLGCHHTDLLFELVVKTGALTLLERARTDRAGRVGIGGAKHCAGRHQKRELVTRGDR